MDRYHRQTLLPQIGPAGQARLAAARVLLVGCGALGTVLADQLARAGVGSLRIVDRDVVELTNLQRQVLFDEADARDGVPKAVAAAKRLAAVNAQVVVEPVVCDLHAGNAEALAGAEGAGGPGTLSAGRVDLILDGTDNVETRYLLNDVAVKHGIPWVYGACVGTEGRMMAVLPGRGACLRCVFPEPAGPGELPTCDTAGVLGAAAAAVASLQAAAAIQLLTERETDLVTSLVRMDVWEGRFRASSLIDSRRDDCRACGLRRFDFLDRSGEGRSVRLCGRNAIQVQPMGPAQLDLPALAKRLHGSGAVELTAHLLRFHVPGADAFRLTLFRDGRAMIQGTQDAEKARSLYARWVGN